ncbi:MAG: hypothetical protein AB1758_17020 [Candidatus Eremiobacterota bacterium]
MIDVVLGGLAGIWLFWGLILLTVGCVACFSGYRSFLVLLQVLGFCAGFPVGCLLAGLFIRAGSQSDQRLSAFIWTLTVGFMAAFVGAYLAENAYRISIFLMGSTAGWVVGILLYGLLTGRMPPEVLVFVFALAGGVAAVALQQAAIIVMTSFGGAVLIATSVVWFRYPGSVGFWFWGIPALVQHALLILGLTAAGIVVQSRWTARGAPTPEQQLQAARARRVGRNDPSERAQVQTEDLRYAGRRADRHVEPSQPSLSPSVVAAMTTPEPNRAQPSGVPWSEDKHTGGVG